MEQPLLSVVIPTKNHAGRLLELAAALRRTVARLDSWEIVFIDESSDHTTGILRGIASLDPRIKIASRSDTAETSPRGAYLCIFDANLTYPPESILTLLQHAEQAGADIAVASRYANAPSRSRGLLRAYFSRLFQGVLRIIYPSLRRTSDPGSSVYLFRAPVYYGLNVSLADPALLLEILARGRYSDVVDVPCEAAPDRPTSRVQYVSFMRNTLSRTATYIRHALARGLRAPYRSG